jgi:deoxyribonuclease-4
MRIGVHVRVGAGYAAALEYAKRVKCTAIQIFSSNPRSYRTSPPNKPALEAFKAARLEAGIDPCVIHTPYLINLASEDPKITAGSVALLKADLASAEAGGIRYVNTHLGSYGKRDRREGFVSACRLLEAALDGIAPDVHLVLENSAGAGALCGGTLEELGHFIKALDHPQLGVCLDTAHAWAAGYEINSQRGVDAFLYEAAEQIGLDRVHMFHFNDTEVPLGGNRDRHHHIGEGNIGFEGFRALASRPELRDKTAILETPGEEADDQRNMETIRAIFKGAGHEVE